MTNPIDFWEKIIYYESNVHGHVKTDYKKAARRQVLLGKSKKLAEAPYLRRKGREARYVIHRRRSWDIGG